MTKKQIKKSPFSLSGFTLVELIVVISILAILGTISFISFSGYLSSSRDSKRISNTAVITKGFDIALITGTPVNTSKTATGYNIAIVGSGLTMTGYYGIVNDTLLQSIKVFGKDIAVYDGFQEYRYGYFPEQKKFQVLAMLENAENARSTFILPSIIEQAFAADSVGYAYIKGNFTSTGGIESIVVDPTVESNKTAVNGIKTFSGATETVTIAAPLALVVATSVPADGVCADVASYKTTPTLLCKTGTLTGSIVTDTNVITGRWTWTCAGVNGGAATVTNSCSANFDNSYNCIFDDPTADSKFGDGTTNYCTFAP